MPGKLSNGDRQVIAIILFIGVVIGYSLSFIPLNKKMQPEVLKVVIYDSIPKSDSIIIARLKPELKARESYSDTVYPDHHGYHYIGYGHMITKECSYLKKITEHKADSILMQDELQRYWKILAENRQSLYRRMYNLFISNHE
jgi:hypothetical protein